MKKVIMSLLFVGLFGAATQAGTGLQEPEHKVTKDTKKAGKKTVQGVKHGAYDVTHNKVTKKTHVNKGNQKYSKQNDIKNN